MIDLKLVSVGFSPGSGRSLFQPARFTRMGINLGETEQSWYTRAKSAVAKYDSLKDRLARIASPRMREALFAQFVGDPANQDSAIYRRDTVAWHVTEAENYTPINYKIFAADAPGQRVRNRVEKLEEWNRSFEPAIQAAERDYGTLPEPVVVERVVEVAAEETNYTIPVVIGSALFAVIILTIAFS